ncbi:MAG: MotA/TolQ/ExbB proton channel family protein [Oscillospiraceae bacterium]|nr:MotA/TolQ/ExbB proton channel family protein [Oscillospiraceae bacterium]
MNLTAIIGLLAGIAAQIYGIMDSGELINFYTLSGIIVTVFGTILALITGTPGRLLSQIPKHLGVVFKNQKNDAMGFVNRIVDFAQLARRSGLLALEERANQESDPFMKNAILQIVDGVDAEKVRAMLEGSIDNIMARHEEAAGFWEKAASLAPAFGMIATVIGLVNMLMGLDVTADGAAEALGANMSMALVTTFYGAFLANVVFSPIASQLKSKSEEEYLCKVIVMEGVLSIQAGENPKYIREKLESMLSQKARAKAGAGAGSTESAE